MAASSDIDALYKQAGEVNTPGAFGMTSQQLQQYFDSLPGPTAAAVQASQAGHSATQLAGARAGQSNTPARADGANVGANGQVDVLNYSPQQQQFLDQVTRSGWTYDTGIDKIMAGVLPIITAAGLGAAFGPVAAEAVGAGAGTVGAGAISGGITGGAGAGLTGQNVAKGTLVGAAGGAIGAEAKPVATGLTNAGVNSTVASGVTKAGAGALTGAIGGAVSGQGAGAGAAHGAINGASGAVAGSIFNSGGTIFSSGNAANPTNNPSLTNPTAPGNMGDDLDPIDTTGQYATNNGDGTVTGGGTLGGSNPGFTNLGVQGGGSTLGGGYTDANGNTTAGNLTGSALAKFLAGMGVGSSGGNGSPAGGNSSLLSSLAGLLTGSGGSANGSLLAQLLGLGATGIGGALSSSAAKGAASTFAGQTKYNPFSVTTANGTNSFNGTNATSTLSPQEQAVETGLNGLTTQAAGALSKGTAPTATADFNSLQASQLDAQKRLMSNTQDNEFANGVLGSTAGQYQTQGALGAIGQQTSQDKVTAQTMADQQQQEQLAQLTAGLNGSNSLNASQLAGLNLGGTIGSAASGANVSAFSPSLAAGSNSNIGTLLQGLGNGASNSGNANNNALQTYLASLMSGGG